MITPYYEEAGITIYHGDCRAVMKQIAESSVSAIVTDPPYGLNFMGKKWDRIGDRSANFTNLDKPHSSQAGFAMNKGRGRPISETDGPAQQAWHYLWAVEALRVLKPGGHLLAFGGSRTYHRLACAIEDAGFEIRDQIQWIYGSGFPKSLDISKAIDASNGKHERDLLPFGEYVRQARERKGWSLRQLDDAMGTNTAASWWEGRKSGVQPPSFETYQRLKSVLGLDDRHDELVVWAEAERNKVGERLGYKAHYGGAQPVSRSFDVTAPTLGAAKQWNGWGTALKPAHEPIVVARKPLIGTVAANVLEYGTGALNIDGCRINGASGDGHWTHKREIGNGNIFHGGGRTDEDFGGENPSGGRWPANVIHDGSEDVTRLFPVSDVNGYRANPSTVDLSDAVIGYSGGAIRGERGHNDTGSAARFFYCAKASKEDREEGLDGTYTVKYNSGLCREENTELVELLARATSELTLRWLIDESGENITGLCRWDSLSTTLTTIRQITTSQILSLLTPSLISAFIRAASCETGNGGSRVGNAESSKKSERIITNASQGLALGANHAVSKMLSAISDGANWKPLTNFHATVKPADLMRYLCRLVTPPQGIVLDPFAGSGSTGKAAALEGLRFIGIELNAEYCELAKQRIAAIRQEVLHFG